MKKKLLSLALAVIMLMTVVVMPANAGVSLPSISSSKYLSTYTYNSSGKVYAYKEAALKNKTGGYISCASDQCRIIKISGNAVQVSYPVSGGRKTAWFLREAFTYRDLANNGAQKVFVATGKVTTYRWKGNSTTFGSIAKNDKCYLLRGDSGSTWLQVIYPVSSGYKMAWVKCAEVKSMIWPSSNVAVSGISVSPSSVSFSKTGATKQLSASISPSNATNKAVSWSSSNSSVATVSSKGLVTAKGAGTCTITAKSSNGKTAKCSISVNSSSYKYKTYTINPSSIEDCIKKIGNAQMNAIGVSGRNFVDANGNAHYKGPTIVGYEVLSYKTVTCAVPIQGPTADGKSLTKTEKIKLPNEIRLKVHSHDYALDSSVTGLGNFLIGIANLKCTATYSCSCGESYTIEWEMPS